MSDLICSTCGKSIDKQLSGNISFQSKAEGAFILKDFRLVHKICDVAERQKEGWLDSWVSDWDGYSDSEKGLKQILVNLSGYNAKIQIDGKSFVRVLLQFL